MTRGTTGTNRLRRVDRYLAASPALRCASSPLVVDLGFGARPWTALELADRLARARPDVRVLGLEIDPARVAAAVPSATGRVTFALGGFEVPTPGDEAPAIIRAMNVLRQYEEAEVRGAWDRMRARLAPGGLLLDGTCDELGRIASWVDVEAHGPCRFTIALRLTGLEAPSVIAERLPKALIHRNVPGERIHDLLQGLDAAWARASSLSVYGPVQRFVATVEALRAAGHPVEGGPKRWRLGELTVPWSSVAPR
ncbi:MAG: class SAM-dependent methyltransferase [Amnibacterium sp.]|nr:class SAM-dependent methyltransferase [Amnibacterium sp.]